MKWKKRPLLGILSNVVFWIGFGLCCLLLIPVCLLLLCVRCVFSLADSCSVRIREIP